MMKYFFLFIFVLAVISCEKANNCNNRFEFISAEEPIPVLKLDISIPYDSVRSQMNQLYGEDLCNRCRWVDFKIPLQIEGQNGYLKIMADFDSPYCKKCPIPIRDRYYLNIIINKFNQVFIEHEVIEKDSLFSTIMHYLSNIGKSDISSSTYNSFNFLLEWDHETDKMFFDSILTIIYKAHLKNVEKILNKEGVDLCYLNDNEIMDMKEEYPLRIELALGRYKNNLPSPEEKMLDFFKKINKAHKDSLSNY